MMQGEQKFTFLFIIFKYYVVTEYLNIKNSLTQLFYCAKISVLNEREVNNMTIRNISFNRACNILEANHWNIDTVKMSHDGKFHLFYHNNKVVARYDEAQGKLKTI